MELMFEPERRLRLRAAVFVDVQNIQEVFEKQWSEVRYDRLREYILQNHDVIKFVAFIPYRKDDEKRQRLIDAISLMGYRCVCKQAKERPDGTVKANMDLEIAIEIQSMLDAIDEVILVTGDSDFVPLVDYLSRKGKRVEVIGPGRGPTALELIRSVDEFENIDEIEGVIIRLTDNTQV